MSQDCLNFLQRSDFISSKRLLPSAHESLFFEWISRSSLWSRPCSSFLGLKSLSAAAYFLASIVRLYEDTMRSGRIGAIATGLMLLILGGTIALIIGKGNIIMIIAGLLMVLGGLYIYSLINPATKRFMGTGWPESLCRISAATVGLLMVASGLSGSIGGIREIIMFQNSAGLNLVLIGLLPLCWGLYILKLTAKGV